MPNSIDPVVSQQVADTTQSIINSYLVQDANRRSQKFSREMYDRQRQDALSDWNMRNDYNHPSAQMARLREAGLNPNLVYGKGADNTSDAVRSSSPQSAKFDAPQLNNDFMRYFDAQVRQAQIDNLRTQNTVMQQEAILKTAQIQQTYANTESTQTGTQRQKFDLSQATALKETSLEMARENLRNLQSSTEMNISENERRAATSTQNIQESIERVITMRLGRSLTAEQIKNLGLDRQVKLQGMRLTEEQILNLSQEQKNKVLDAALKANNIGMQEYETKIKKLTAEMMEMGLTPTDAWFWRVLNRMFRNSDPQQSPPSGGHPLMDY